MAAESSSATSQGCSGERDVVRAHLEQLEQLRTEARTFAFNQDAKLENLAIMSKAEGWGDWGSGGALARSRVGPQGWRVVAYHLPP